jgi:hypothetical protein
MSQQHQALRLYTKGDVQLAISNVQSNQVKSLRRAKVVYSVPRRTIQRRRNEKRPQRDYEPKSKRLTKLEEEAIIQRVLKESLRSIAPSKACVQDIANRLLRERSRKPTGKN